MTRAVLPFLLLGGPVAGQSSHDLVATDFEFLPNVLVIQAGDTVNIYLGEGHGFREITANAWNLNVTTPAIGFDFPPESQSNTHFIVLPPVADTLYYICVPHADMGMKGRIIVLEGNIGVEETPWPVRTAYPNPTEGPVLFDPPVQGAVQARITDAAGRITWSNVERDGGVDLALFPPGPYVIDMMDADRRLLHHGMVMLQY